MDFLYQNFLYQNFYMEMTGSLECNKLILTSKKSADMHMCTRDGLLETAWVQMLCNTAVLQHLHVQFALYNRSVQYTEPCTAAAQHDQLCCLNVVFAMQA